MFPTIPDTTVGTLSGCVWCRCGAPDAAWAFPEEGLGPPEELLWEELDDLAPIDSSTVVARGRESPSLARHEPAEANTSPL